MGDFCGGVYHSDSGVHAAASAFGDEGANDWHHEFRQLCRDINCGTALSTVLEHVATAVGWPVSSVFWMLAVLLSTAGAEDIDCRARFGMQRLGLLPSETGATVAPVSDGRVARKAKSPVGNGGDWKS